MPPSLQWHSIIAQAQTQLMYSWHTKNSADELTNLACFNTGLGHSISRNVGVNSSPHPWGTLDSGASSNAMPENIKGKSVKNVVSPVASGSKNKSNLIDL